MFQIRFLLSLKMSVMATINKVFTAGADWSEKEELLDVICDAYPPEVVEFCSPDYAKTLARATFAGDAVQA